MACELPHVQVNDARAPYRCEHGCHNIAPARGCLARVCPLCVTNCVCEIQRCHAPLLIWVGIGCVVHAHPCANLIDLLLHAAGPARPVLARTEGWAHLGRYAFIAVAIAYLKSASE